MTFSASSVRPRAITLRPARTRTSSSITPYLLVLPGFVFVLGFTIYPIGSTFIRSLFREDLAHPTAHFAGLANFRAIFRDDAFVHSLRVTALYALMVVPIAVVAALLLAILLNRKTRLLGLCRAAFFYPVVLPLVSAASIWLFIMTPEYGLLARVGGLIHLDVPALLAHPDTALWALAIVAIWRQTGFYTMFLLAGLQEIDPDVEAAAQIDGAGAFRLTWSIRLAALRPTLIFVVTLALFNAFQTVDLVYVMTQGGPDQSTSLVLFQMYQTEFSFQNTGRASAMSVVFLAMLAVVALVQVFVVNRLREDTHA